MNSYDHYTIILLMHVDLEITYLRINNKQIN